MKKTIIGIMPRACEIENKPQLYINDTIRRLIIKNDCYPLFIMPPQDVSYFTTEGEDIKPITVEETKFLFKQINMCDGLLMPGGGRQFEFDRLGYKYALSKDIPILGICMGMQVMCNVDNSSSTYYDVPIRNESHINHRQIDIPDVHKISINRDSKLYDIVGRETLTVNSLHNYHIERVTNLKVSARSEDGYIEAVEMPGKNFVIGVQWHPEILAFNDPINNKIITSFIKSAKEVKYEEKAR